MEEQLNINYWQQQWRDLPSTKKKRWRIFLVVFVLLWLAGSVYAYNEIAGIATMATGSRLIGAAVVGPLGLLWFVLTMTGVITESTNEPSKGWLLLLGIQLGWLYLAGKIAWSPPNRAVQQQREAAQQQKAQGHLTETAAAEKFALKQGIPLVTVKDKQQKPVQVGMDAETGQGHILVISPTRGGKGLNLTEVLRHWPGAAVIVDPKSEVRRAA